MADETAAYNPRVNVDLTVVGAETFVPAASSRGELPCAVYYLLFGSGAGRIHFRHGGARLPAHRLAVLLGQARLVDGAVSIDQHQIATLFLTRPTEDAEDDGKETAAPPFCGHAGNAEYKDGEDRPGGVGGGEEEEGDEDESAQPDVSPDDGPGDGAGETTPVSSGDCEPTDDPSTEDTDP